MRTSKLTELSQIAGGGMANKSLDKECRYLALTPFALYSFKQKPRTKGASIMAMYVSLLQFTDQGIRNVNDTIKRAEAATAEAEKMGIKIMNLLWTMGAYDLVFILDAPNDETVSAFSLKTGSLGNVKSQTMRAFRREEMESLLAKIK
jgi:uncharacterized protein with GYD domain